jgi:hypothetical protein
MALGSKVLWIVDMKSESVETAFAKHAGDWGNGRLH